MFQYKGGFIFPPRAETMQTHAHLPQLEGGEWVGQPKMNGSCCVVSLPDCTVWNRHGDKLSNVGKHDWMQLYRRGEITGLVNSTSTTDTPMLLVGEYLNKSQIGQTGNVFNNKFCIFDIIAYDGKMLIGTSLELRLKMLDAMYGQLEDVNESYLYSIGWSFESQDFYRVITYRGRFHKIYERLTSIPVVEGLVMKRLNATLSPGVNEMNNSGWQLKFRKENNLYKF